MTERVFRPHSNKQEQAILTDKKILLLATGTQWGKGLPLDELVLTPSGYTKVVNIKVGDTLFDRDGKPTIVTGVFPQGLRPCFQINFKEGNSLITDDQHLNVIIPRTNRPERIITTQDLFNSKFLHGRAKVPAITSPIELDEKRYLVISPYVMGALLGDGCLVNSVRFSSIDDEIINRISDELPEYLKISKVSGDNCDYIITNKIRETDKNGYGVNRFINEFKLLGVLGKKSYNKSIPDIYKYSSIDQRIDLLRGLMDTDGSITNKSDTKSGRTVDFYSTSKKLADDVVFLVESLGGKAKIHIKKAPKYIYKGEHKIGRDCYRVNVLLHEINPFYLTRKADKHFRPKNLADKVIKDVVKVKPRKTVCFSVDSLTKTYIARGQVVTHNTNVGAIRMKQMLHTHTNKLDNFIITSPSYKIMQQSTLPAFLNYMEGFGEYDKKFDIFRMYEGGTVYCRTETDPDSIVGITNVRHIWCDEAGKYRKYFWENIQARADFCGCAIDLTTSPYSINWIYKELIKPSLAGKRPDVDYITAASWDNPYHSLSNPEKRRAKEATMDSRRFRMIFGGAFEKMEGLVYDCFSEEEHQCDSFALPSGTKYYGGIDWGFNPDPFVLKVRAITPSGHHFDVSEHYQTRLTITDILTICKQKLKTYNIERFYADPSQPGYIEFLSRNGIPIVGAINDLRLGIDTHYELIKSGHYKMFRGYNPYSLDEYSTYHYPEPDDLGPDQKAKENVPVDQANHVMDAVRYTSIMTYKSQIKHTPHMPNEDKKEIKQNHEARIKELRKPNRQFHGSEKF